ncbi:MAG: hypothetical protein ACREXR_24495 [Gammaproteobacteria bacterium]
MKIRKLDLTRNPSSQENPRLGLPPVEATVTHRDTHPVKNKLIRSLCTIAALLGAALPSFAAGDVTLLNVSYDPKI